MCRLAGAGARRKIIFTLFFLLICAASLCAKGKQEEEKQETQNTEFILCVTAFDVSELPPSQQILGFLMQRKLAGDLGRIHHRIRSGGELSRYEELAILMAAHKAAVPLSAKRAERDALLYRNLPNWKYKKELKRVDKEIVELDAAYKKAVETMPLIAEKPLFKISELNTKGEFPPPPSRSGEEAFLKTSNADAVLEGKFRLVYGRVYAEFRLFTRGASFIYEDDTIFSSDNLNAAADELKDRFLAALINAEPARISLTADPPNARLEVNGRLVQSGAITEVPPGPVIARASADDHQGEARQLQMEGGETEDIAFTLRPFITETLDITMPGPGSSIYLGAEYLGGSEKKSTDAEEQAAGEESSLSGEVLPGESAPDAAETLAAETEDTADTAGGVVRDKAGESGQALAEETAPVYFSINVPMGQYRYIRVETEDGLTGEAIVKGGEQNGVRIITMEPRKLPGKDDTPVEDKRKKFYGAYGRFWVTFPAAFLINGFSRLYTTSYNASGSPALFKDAKNLYYISMGAWVVAGVFLVETLIRMGIYVHASSNEAVPLVE